MKPSESDKIIIRGYFNPLIEKFKKQYISKNPDKRFNYIVDIYSKWHQNSLYFCKKYKSERSNRIADEFEVKFVRLKYTDKNQFDISYLRHTGKWELVTGNLTMKDCMEMMLSVPTLQPSV